MPDWLQDPVVGRVADKSWQAFGRRLEENRQSWGRLCNVANCWEGWFKGEFYLAMDQAVRNLYDSEDENSPCYCVRTEICCSGQPPMDLAAVPCDRAKWDERWKDPAKVCFQLKQRYTQNQHGRIVSPEAAKKALREDISKSQPKEGEENTDAGLILATLVLVHDQDHESRDVLRLPDKWKEALEEFARIYGRPFEPLEVPCDRPVWERPHRVRWAVVQAFVARNGLAERVTAR